MGTMGDAWGMRGMRPYFAVTSEIVFSFENGLGVIYVFVTDRFCQSCVTFAKSVLVLTFRISFILLIFELI